APGSDQIPAAEGAGTATPGDIIPDTAAPSGATGAAPGATSGTAAPGSMQQVREQAAVQPPPLQQIWEMPKPQSLIQREQAVEAARQKLEQLQPFDWTAPFQDKNLQALANYWDKFAGPKPDYSKVEASI